MERSTNYNLYLPSSDDDDLAEVNELSSNFEAIDTVLGDKEELSTDETETFVGAINEVNGKIPAVDQTFDPTSEHAQSGVAVAEAISAIRVETMPEETPLEDEGKIVQYVGATTTDYIHGYFYQAVDNGDACIWEQFDVQPQVDNEIFVADENTTYNDILDAIGMFEDDDPHVKAVFYKLITGGNFDTVHYLPLGSIDDSHINLIQFCGLISYMTVPNEFEACCVKIDTDDERTITYRSLYTKSNEGIPKTDLTSAVQASLNKADTALQSDDIDQTYNPTSENAQSGIAVAEALSDSVSYSTQSGKTEMQKAQARQNINASAPDGYYGDSGGVYQYSTNFVGKNLPQNAHDIVFRPTASQFSGQSWGANSVGGQAATIDKIKGKTLVFNQLVQNGNFASSAGWLTANLTSLVNNNVFELTTLGRRSGSSITVGRTNTQTKSGHKYYASIDVETPANSIAFILGWGAGQNKTIDVTPNVKERHAVIFNPSVDSVSFYIYPFSTTATVEDGSIAYISNVILIDLTKMYGAGNEPATVAEFKAQFPLDYYEYNAGELISLNATGLKTTGFNQLYPDGHIDVIKGIAYKIEGNYTSLKDSAGNDVAVLNGEFTPTANDTYTMVGGSCVHLKWSGVRDGDIEEHWDRTLSLPISTYFPDGMKSVGTVYDELTKDKAVKRIGSRPYQSGDENDNTVITDGTTTNYILEAPVETPINPQLNLTYKCDDFGTEMLLPQNDDEPVTASMDADIVYQLDYEANIRNMDINTISKASMDNFISAFNNSGLGEITQVWDDTNKRYTYTVSPPAPVQ